MAEEPPETRRACARAALLVALLLSALPAVSLAQLSPGKLSAPHAALDGAASCFRCHGGGEEGTLDDNCQSCHKAIAFLVQSGRGLHGRMAKNGCSSCHPEHAGADFQLIEWPEGSPELFRHERSGWPLAGKHAQAKCRDCHQPKRQSASVVSLMQRKNPAESWIGLDRLCTTCHEDRHRGALGADCLKCHSQAKWKPAINFDHAQTEFPLKGKHIEAECAKCHLAARLKLERDAAGHRVPLYKPLEHKECSACHKDPHTGRLGADCSRCHVEEGFHRINRKGFDHSKTRYPLRGAHLKLDCRQCHDPKRAWGRTPAFERCTSCHSDPHAGRATLRGAAVDCSACHREQAFVPAIYSVADHRSAKYPLEGKHREVACRKCHAKHEDPASLTRLGKAGIELRPASSKCSACHEDVHGGQLARRQDKGECSSCHDVGGFRPSTFTVQDHGRLEFPLEGRHREVECQECHGPKRHDLPPLPGPQRIGKAGVVIKLDTQRCEQCHRDPHDKHFAAKSAAGGVEGCTDCHGAESFAQSRIEPATHKRHGFALEGAHRAIPCSDCHKELAGRPAEKTLLLSTAPMRKLPFGQQREHCRECHEDPHDGQFDRRTQGARCGLCHGAESFRPASNFDHERDARFALGGAHRKVSCEKCHQKKKVKDGRQIVLYRPTPLDCRSCHRGGAPDPATTAAAPTGRPRTGRRGEP